MKPIKLTELARISANVNAVEIQLIGGPYPYLGIDIKEPGKPTRWHPIADKDLYRLEKAIRKCRKALKKSRK